MRGYEYEIILLCLFIIFNFLLFLKGSINPPSIEELSRKVYFYIQFFSCEGCGKLLKTRDLCCGMKDYKILVRFSKPRNCVKCKQIDDDFLNEI